MLSSSLTTAAEGDPEWAIVGTDVGLAVVGELVGTDVGLAVVGELVGTDVGLAVVGELVGEGDGSSVGLLVTGSSSTGLCL